jgi:hypothetical protein
MKSFGLLLGYSIVVLGSFGIGAWLVIQGHPWFAVLIILLGGSVSVKNAN